MGPWITFGLAILAIAAVVGEALRHWRVRTRNWLSDPQRLMHSPGWFRPLAWAGAPLAVLAWAETMKSPDVFGSPLSAILAGVAFLSLGHITGVIAVSAVGLVGVAGGVVLIPSAWFGVGPLAPIMGLSLAALWLLWLARFWEQQLLDGRGWTTAGRLVPVAAAAAVVAIGAALLVALRQTLAAQHADFSWSTSHAIALLLSFGTAIAFGMRAARRDSAPARLGLWFVVSLYATVIGPAVRQVPAFGLPIAAIAVLFVVRGSAGYRRVGLADRVFAFGFCPTITILIALGKPAAEFAAALIALAVFLTIAAILLRPGRKGSILSATSPSASTEPPETQTAISENDRETSESGPHRFTHGNSAHAPAPARADA